MKKNNSNTEPKPAVLPELVRKHYTFHTIWSEEDSEYVGLVDRMPGMSWLDPEEPAALQGMKTLLAEIFEDMDEPELVAEAIFTLERMREACETSLDAVEDLTILEGQAQMAQGEYIADEDADFNDYLVNQLIDDMARGDHVRSETIYWNHQKSLKADTQ